MDFEKAIKSSSFSTTSKHHSTVNNIADGDETTWSDAAGAMYPSNKASLAQQPGG
jgi:hypothetical protein